MDEAGEADYISEMFGRREHVSHSFIVSEHG